MADITYIDSECVDGKQERTYLYKSYCSGGAQLPDPEILECRMWLILINVYQYRQHRESPCDFDYCTLRLWWSCLDCSSICNHLPVYPKQEALQGLHQIKRERRSDGHSRGRFQVFATDNFCREDLRLQMSKIQHLENPITLFRTLFHTLYIHFSTTWSSLYDGQQYV